MHATAVLVGADGVLLRGPSGAGKSTLAWLLIDRGARLVGDDRIHLSACHGRIIANPADALAGRLELRGRGILPVAFERSVVIRLVVDLVDELERLPGADALSAELLGVRLPRQPVPGASARSVLLIAAALGGLAHGGDTACGRPPFGEDGGPSSDMAVL